MDKELLKEIAVKGLLRHGTQGIGGGIVAVGIQAGHTKTVAVGLAMNAGAFVWSAFRKWNRKRKAKRNA